MIIKGRRYRWFSLTGLLVPLLFLAGYKMNAPDPEDSSSKRKSFSAPLAPVAEAQSPRPAGENSDPSPLATPVPTPVPAELFDLRDQNDEPFQWRDGADRLVMIIVSQQNEIAITAWSDWIKISVPASCQIVQLLDLKKMMPATAPIVRSQIRRRQGPDPFPIYLDWKGAFTEKFDVQSEVATIFCFDRQFRPLVILRGDMTPEFQETLGRICKTGANAAGN